MPGPRTPTRRKPSRRVDTESSIPAVPLKIRPSQQEAEEGKLQRPVGLRLGDDMEERKREGRMIDMIDDSAEAERSD